MRDDAEREYVEYVTARVPALRRLAFVLIGDGHRADDLVQQTITRLYLKWHRAQAADNLDAYVRTMLVRTYVDEKRLAWSRVRLFRETPEAAAVEEIGAEDRHVLRAALRKLPRRQRAVVVLRFFYDLSVEEVGATLGCSTGTVKSQTSRGLAALRTCTSATSAVPAPTACTLTRLPAPDKAPMAIIGAGDRTGRYLVGRSYPTGGGYQAVLWHDGAPEKVMLPGDREEDLSAVNSSGIAVGFSYDARGSVPYAYSDGKVTRLPGVRHGNAYAINDAGTIVGDNETEAPTVWKSLTAAPTKLPLPAGTKRARASDIDEDGTIVGSLDFKVPYVWLPDGTHRELPMPEVDGKPVAVAQAHNISNGWVTGMASTSELGPRGSAQQSESQLRAVRWNLRTGRVAVTAALTFPADDVNADGWQIGTDKTGHAVLVTASGTVALPDLATHRTDGTATIANTMSDDGRLIAGQSDDKKGVIQPIVWHCE